VPENEIRGNVARILTFTSGPADWQKLLADPVKQWRTGYSARTLAYCWEAADGFPPEVAKALQQTDEASLGKLTPVLAIPEFKVPLPGGVRPSQNDLFVLARGAVQKPEAGSRPISQKVISHPSSYSQPMKA
jgi:hypothetical protein